MRSNVGSWLGGCGAGRAGWGWGGGMRKQMRMVGEGGKAVPSPGAVQGW